MRAEMVITFSFHLFHIAITSRWQSQQVSQSVSQGEKQSVTDETETEGRRGRAGRRMLK